MLVFLFALCSSSIWALEGVSAAQADSLLTDTIPSETPEFFVLESSNDSTITLEQSRKEKKERKIKEVEKEKKDTLHKEFFKPDPKKATWYAVVCPGLGQIYNRSYWKLPILYGGVLSFTYLIGWNGRMYNDYHNAYRDMIDNDPNTNSYIALSPGYNDTQTWLQSTLKTKMNRYRRARDMSTFGLVALYAISVIDAFVDAHLYDFSVTDDLSMRVEPVINTYGFQNTEEARRTSIVGVNCSFRFK